MKLSVKLPLAFAMSLALLFAGAMFGIYQLNLAVSTFENNVLLHVVAHKKAAEVSTRFATAIQEWKNVLLRGKKPEDLDKYWKSHRREMDEVNKAVQEHDKLIEAGNPDGQCPGRLCAGAGAGSLQSCRL